MKSIEYERTFLASRIPDGLSSCEYAILEDTYFPISLKHCHLRLRRKGDNYEITKKLKQREGDPSSFVESTIILDRDEYLAFSSVDGKRISKKRYKYVYNAYLLEVDVFMGGLEGLILIDVEFTGDKEKDLYVMPPFCLYDATRESFLAGGKLAGKSYIDIKPGLDGLGYTKLDVSSLE